MDKQLKPVRVRLGITDGTNTELLSGELTPGMDVVTGVVMSNARTTTAGGGTGNPLLGPQRGPGGPGGGPGRGR
jgi:HlyD family secretion protein